MDENLTLKNGTISIAYYEVYEYYDEDRLYDMECFTTFSEAKKFLIAWLLRTQKITMDDLHFFDVVDGEKLSVKIGEDSYRYWGIVQQRKIMYASADEAELMRGD